MIRENRCIRLAHSAVRCRLLLPFAAKHRAILVFLVGKGPQSP